MVTVHLLKQRKEKCFFQLWWHYCIANPIGHLGISHDQNLHIWGVNNAHLGGQKCQIWPMTQISIFCEPKLKKPTLICFCPKCPQSHLEVSNDQNLHFFCGPKMPKTEKRTLKKLVLSLMLPTVIWGCPMTKISTI